MTDVAEAGGGSPTQRSAAGVYPLALGVAAVVIGLDALTKRWAVSSLSNDRTRHVFWTLHFELLYNPGMAFSKGRGLGPFIALAVLVVVAVLLRSLKRPRSRFYVMCVGAVVGGAIGNWLDRVFRAKDGILSGHVVDFINFQWWPAFNVADMAVVVGAALLMFESWRHERVAHQQQTSSVQA